MTKRLGAALAMLGFWLALALLGFWLAGASPAAGLTLQATDDASTNLNRPGTNFGSNASVFVRNMASGTEGRKDSVQSNEDVTFFGAPRRNAPLTPLPRIAPNHGEGHEEVLNDRDGGGGPDGARHERGCY